MAKNTKRQAKKNLVTEQSGIAFKILKDEFKKLIKAQAKNVAYAGMGSGILTGIKFSLDDDILTMISTDGMRLLETKVRVCESSGGGHGVYSGTVLGKIQFLKSVLNTSDGYIDLLTIVMGEKSMTITDEANNITYNIPAINSNSPYPPTEQLFPEVTEEYTTIGLNIAFVKELEKLAVDCRTNIVKFSVKNNAPLNPVMVESRVADEIATRALIMPIQIRE